MRASLYGVPVKVTFSLEASTGFGELVYLVGESPVIGASLSPGALPPFFLHAPRSSYPLTPPHRTGSWNPHRGVQMVTSSTSYPTWTCQAPVTLDGKSHVDYKYAIFSGGTFQRWENFDGKRTVQLPNAAAGEMGDALKRQVTINDVLDARPAEVPLAVLDSARVERPESTSGSAQGDTGEPTSTDYSGDSSTHDQPTLSFDFPALREITGIGSGIHKRVRSISNTSSAAFRGRRDGLIMVSRYLPVTLTKVEGEWIAEFDEERLLASKAHTGTEHISKRMRCVWIGAIPFHGDAALDSRENPRNEHERAAVTLALERLSCVPVFLDPKIERSSEIFARKTLWPALHNVTPVFARHSTQWFNRSVPEALWQGFTEVNRTFAQKVVEVYDGADDLIWINDYHLMLLPTFLAHKMPSATIGIFIHTPWPSSEIFRTLSFRTKLLRAMLNADQIGFGLFEYARHFVHCCRRMLGVDFVYERKGRIVVHTSSARQVVITMSVPGVEPALVRARLNIPSVAKQVIANTAKYAGRFVIGGLDWADRLSGIPLKLLAFERLLEQRPELASSVVFVQIAHNAQSDNVGQETESSTHELVVENGDTVRALVAAINARFGECVEYIELAQSANLNRRLALYAVTDLLVCSAVRQATHRVPLEYVVSRSGGSRGRGNGGESATAEDAAASSSSSASASSSSSASSPSVPQTSTVLMSEFAGCHRILSGAERTNPWNTEQFAAALGRCIDMQPAERMARHQLNVERAENFTTTVWAAQIATALKRAHKRLGKMKYTTVGYGMSTRVVAETQAFTVLPIAKLCTSWRWSSRRIVILDFDSIVERDSEVWRGLPSPKAAPSAAKRVLPEHVTRALASLSQDRRNTIFVVSGYARAQLDPVLGAIPGLGIAAEHGFQYRYASSRRGNRFGGTHPRAGGAVQPSADEWHSLAESGDAYEWKDIALNIMKVYTQRTNGSRTFKSRDSTSATVTWDYSESDAEFGALQAKELVSHLNDVLSQFAVEITEGSDHIEVRPRGVSKEAMVLKIIEEVKNPSFLLCIGANTSDEPIFLALEQLQAEYVDRANVALYTCTVGKKPSEAKHFVHSVEDVHATLLALQRTDDKVRPRERGCSHLLIIPRRSLSFSLPPSSSSSSSTF